MEKETTVKLIGEIDFLDIKVKVYQDTDKKDDLNSYGCMWKARNPDSFYKGIIFRNNETGKFTYPEGAIIPEQTKRDREMIPRVIITGKSFDKLDINGIMKYLESDHKLRNGLK